MKSLKKVFAVILSLCLIATSMPSNVFAEKAEVVVDKEALRVSDEFVQLYPNGYVEFATTFFDTVEGDGTLDVIVARRGGTQGSVNVNFKVVETSAKYGEDFKILMPKGSGYEELKKDEDTPTIMESNVLDADAEDQVITSTRLFNDDQDDEVVPEEIAEDEEIIDEPENLDSTDSDVEENLEVTQQNGDVEYKSKLHKQRDEALGVVSSYTEPETYSSDFFNIENQQDIDMGEAVNILLPGVEGELHFADGENYKTFKIQIIDDDLYETPEQLIIGLFEPTGGAVLGERFNTGCTINDNDPEEDYAIEFESSEYTAVDGQESVRLKLVKTGALNAITDAEISTRGADAVADEHYVPVLNTAVFLPGETVKYVDVPLIPTDTDVSRDFDVVLSENSSGNKSNNVATVTIEPKIQTSGEETKISSTGIQTMAATSSRDRITLTPSSFGSAYGHATRSGESSWNLITKGSATERSGASGEFDLRGIESVLVHWRTAGDNNRNALAYVTVSNKKDSFQKKRGWQTENITSWPAYSGFDKKANATIKFEAYRAWWQESNVYFGNVTLMKQKFSISIAQPDKLSYSQFASNGAKSKVADYNPGSVSLSQSTAYRDESITITPTLDASHVDKGTVYKGFYICDKYNNPKTDLFTSQTITLTPDFIQKYIYNIRGLQNDTALVIKPVFERADAKGMKIADYDTKAGLLKHGDKTFSPSEILEIAGAKVGDLFVPTLTPNSGYEYKGISVHNEKAKKTTEYRVGEPVAFSDDSVLTVKAQKSSKNISIGWKAPKDGNPESEGINKTRGMIYHDQWSKMPANEKAVLFDGVDYNKVYTAPVAPGAEMTKSQRERFEKEQAEYQAKIKSRSDKIDANYPAYRDNFSTFSINSVDIGEVITFYAKPQAGYSVRWFTNLTEDSSAELEDNLTKYTPHYGSSYSVKVTQDLTNVYYYFTPNSTSDGKLFKGRVVSGTSTLKSQKIYDVNPKNPNSFVGVEGVHVSVGTAGNSNSSQTVGDKTYYTSTTTDKYGNFTIYVPNAVEQVPFSLKMSNGASIYAKSGMLGRELIYVIPFMDEYRVESMSVEGVRDDCTTLKPIDEKKKITFDTDLDPGRIVQNLVMRSYDADGSLWTAIEAHRPPGTTKWVIETNLFETLKDGGSLTVEVYDERNFGHGEIRCGYTIQADPKPSAVNFPSQDSIGNGVNLEIIGNASPSMDFGSLSNEVPQEEADQKTYTIAIKTGKVLKQVIEDNAEKLESKSAQEKVTTLISYLCGNYTNLVDKTWKSKPGVTPPPGSVKRPPEGEAAQGKTKTGNGKTALSIDFDFGYYLQLTRSKVNNKSVFTFDYSVIFAAGSLNFKASYNFNIAGFPVYVSFAAGGAIKGLVLAAGRNNLEVGNTSTGWMPAFGTDGADWVSVLQGDIYISLGAGVGSKGLLSVGISGKLGFHFQYQYAKDNVAATGSQGAGTVSFGLSVDIDVLFIPISIQIHEWTWELFQTSNFAPNDWMTMPNTFRAINAAAGNADVSVEPIEQPDSTTWFGDKNMQGADPGVLSSQKVLQAGGLNNQSPLIMAYSDASGTEKNLIVFLDNDENRNEYSCSAISYTVAEDLELNLWSAPKIIQDDGTHDSDPSALDIGDKILVTWVSNRTAYTEMPKPSDMLNASDIYMAYFDKATETFSAPTRVTESNFANSKPHATISEAGELLISYLATDYKTENRELDLDALTQEKINEFVNGAYSTIAYSVQNDDSTWAHNYAPIDIPDVTTPFISELTIGDFKDVDGKKLAVLVYCFDQDNDVSTTDDTELYAITYDFTTKAWGSPLALTDNDYEDNYPQLVEKDNELMLLWNAAGRVNTLDLSGALNYGFDSVVSHLIYDEENFEMSKSFNASVGKDGNTYLVWTEDYNYIEVIDEDDTSTEEDNVETNTGRGVYFAMYDEKFDMLEVDGEVAYVGAWGNSFLLTPKDNKLNDTPALAANSLGEISVLSVESILEEENVGGSKVLKKSSTSDLLLRTYDKSTSLTIHDVYTIPEYPSPNQPFTLYIDLENHGSMPSEGITTSAQVYRGGNLVPDESSTFEPVNAHLGSSQSVTLTYEMTLTETADTSLELTIYEDDLLTNAETLTMDLNHGTKLECELSYGEQYSAEKASIRTAVNNLGNIPATGLEFFVEKANVPEVDENGDALQTVTRTLYGSQELPDINPHDVEFVNLDVEIPQSSDPEDNINEVRLAIRNSAGEELYSAPLFLDMMPTESKDIEGLLVNDVDSPDAVIQLTEGSMQQLSTVLYPIETSMEHDLLLSCGDTNIFEIDEQSGFIKANELGEAVLTIQVLSKSNLCVQQEDGRLFSSDGTVVKFNSNGTVDGSLASTDSTVVETYEIPVIVTPNLSTQSHTISATSGTGGSVSPNGLTEVAAGSNAKFRFTPDAGYAVESVFVDGEDLGKLAAYEFSNVRENHNLHVTFAKRQRFDDVSDSRWSEIYIYYLADRGVVSGVGGNLFAPSRPTTRAEFVKMLAKLDGINEAEYTESSFTDVKGWSVPYIEWAAKNQIVIGTSSTEFSPNRLIKRQEVAAILNRYCEYAKVTLPKDVEKIVFADEKNISTYAKGAVSLLQQAGVINGVKTADSVMFYPRRQCSREAAAKMIAVLGELLGY